MERERDFLLSRLRDRRDVCRDLQQWCEYVNYTTVFCIYIWLK
jgi:hypothetical protein